MKKRKRSAAAKLPTPRKPALETEVHASFANRTNVGCGKWQWSGPKLLALGDITNRLNYLSGTHIEIWVQQTTSLDNFAKPVEWVSAEGA